MFVNRRKPKDPERRVPKQKRAHERIERILDAAADVFARVGVEAATIEQIAEEAGTSVGSIYQFFPNKIALFEELARRYHEKVKVFFDGLIGGALLDLSVKDILDASVDAVWVFHEQETAFRAVWGDLGFTRNVLVEGEALNKEFARRIEGVLGKKLVALPVKKRPIVATVMVEVLTAMLILSTRRGSAADSKALREETKILLRRYVEPYEVRLTR